MALHKDLVMMAQEKSVKKEQKKLDTKSLRDRNREKVRVMFKFDEAPGQTLSFVFREFKEDPIERYDLVDGQVYSLPLGVVKHINKNMYYPVHRHIKNEDGTSSMKIGTKVRRASCQSLEFIDVEDIGVTPDIATVELGL
jgi:hypothetical protein